MSSDIVRRLRDLFYPDQIEWEASDEIERLRAERDGHKARLAIEAVTAPDADYDTMMDSLQARLRDLHAEVERLRAAGDALAKWLWRGGGDLADMIAAVAAWEEARREQ